MSRAPSQLAACRSENGSGCAPNPVALIVDDERVNRDIIKVILEAHGYDTLEAEEGVEALGHISGATIDLVLLDISMPGIDGFEVLKRLRKDKNETELPVIMVTASTETEQIVKAFELGANDYLSKPIDVPVTMARISTQMRLKRMQTALRESEERYSLAARGANDGLWDWNLKTGRVYYSERWLAMLGLTEADSNGTVDVWLNHIHPEDRLRVETELHRHLSGESAHFEAELRMEHSEGGFRWMLCRGLAVRDDEGKAHRMAGSLTDITEGKVADALTSLPNRVLLLERLQRCLDRRREHGEAFALLFLDLDNFKQINDGLGHDAGDRLLVSFARRLEGCVRTNDSVVSRLGGDEFAVLLERISRPDDAITVAERIISSIAVPFSIGAGKDIQASASLGISLGEDGCLEATDVLREADIAMYQAKARGKSQFSLFGTAFHLPATPEPDMESALQRALEQSEFELHYQPIVETATGEMSGFEALLRWQHPKSGLILPASFLETAEKTKTTIPLGHWVLDEACRQLADWKHSHPHCGDLTINVNISSEQLRDGNIVDEVRSVLDTHQLPGQALILEITERTVGDRLETMIPVLKELRQLGALIALDDFGTGSSSLTQLYQLPLDVLKIDAGFISQIHPSAEKHAVLDSILHLAAGLGLRVIAEGVETSNQWEILTRLGCEQAQGYFFSRPLPAEETPIESWCRLPIPQSAAQS